MQRFGSNNERSVSKGCATRLVLLAFCSIVLYNGCKKEESVNTPAPPGYVTGKNRFTITVDAVEREYYVHVPARYSGNTATPIVIMCHGTGQTGEQFYNISGWKEVGDSANILTAFPSSLSYCITEDGVTQTTPKWNSFPGGFAFCAGVTPKDDVKFMRQMIAELKTRFNVDSKRIYMAGFSNGGQFSATCAVQLSDIVAATVSCGGGGALPRDSTYTPLQLLPTMLMFGNKDEKMLRGLGLPPTGAVPMGFPQLYSVYPYLYLVQPKPFINTFRLDTTYTLSGDTNSVAVASYAGRSGPNNVFVMLEVKGLIHEYPNGVSHPMKAASVHWAWMKNYSLP